MYTFEASFSFSCSFSFSESVGYHLVFIDDQVESRLWSVAGGSSQTFVVESPGECARAVMGVTPQSGLLPSSLFPLHPFLSFSLSPFLPFFLFSPFFFSFSPFFPFFPHFSPFFLSFFSFFFDLFFFFFSFLFILLFQAVSLSVTVQQMFV